MGCAAIIITIIAATASPESQSHPIGEIIGTSGRSLSGLYLYDLYIGIVGCNGANNCRGKLNFNKSF